MLKTIELKLYLNKAQAETLSEWLRVCCWTYNRALEHRIKSYQRRGKNVSFYDQCALLTHWRSFRPDLLGVPLCFERDALRRVHRGFAGFFRRVKSGEKPGFPRFRRRERYNSLESLVSSAPPHTPYTDGRTLRIPKLGIVRCRGLEIPKGTQQLMRVIKRASGWFAQVIIDDGRSPQTPRPARASVGVDVGLSSFASLSNGEQIDNPRWGRESASKLRAVQRRVSRRVEGSRNRYKAIHRLRRVHERIASQRRNFCHQHSTDLVRRFDLIAIENLNVKGMARSRFAKSILDAAWSTFTTQLECKAEDAGVTLVRVDARGTSQVCPDCGASCPKTLSDRTHECKTCGLRCDRDVAAARVILSRAEGNRRVTPVEDSTTTQNVCAAHAGPVKQEVPLEHCPPKASRR